MLCNITKVTMMCEGIDTSIENNTFFSEIDLEEGNVIVDFEDESLDEGTSLT